MGPSELRARIFVTLGLPASLVVVVPACGGSKPPDAPIVRAEADAGASLPVAVAPPPEGHVCPTDQAPERKCGSVEGAKLQPYPFAACPSTATSLRLVLSSKTVEHGGWEGREIVSSGGNAFTFDADETELEVKRQLRGQPLERGVYKSSMCCFVRCAPLEVAASPDPVPPRSMSRDVCIPSPHETSVPAPGAPACPRAVRLEGRMLGFTRASDGQCCYAKTSPACEPGQYVDPSGGCHYHNRGRPLREEGVPRLAATKPRGGWASTPSPGSIRAEVAAAWSAAAAAEHSSVAAFAQLSLSLLALGAPSELVQACHVAAMEEVDHAARSYAIASRFAGVALGPGPLPLPSAAPPVDLVRLAIETFTEGCVAETAAALEAEEARVAADDHEIQGTLEVIARDEASHAAFAFRLVAWALREGGAPVRAALEDKVASVEEETLGRPPREGLHVSFGMLDAASFAAVRARALREVVLPCARAMLAA